MTEFRLGQDDIIKASKHLISGSHEPFLPGETYISPHGAIIDSEDVGNLVACALSGWITEGAYSKEYSRQLKLYLDQQVRSVTLCNSGSSANLLAITAITDKAFGERRLLPGDEVITTAVNFPTTVNAIVQNRAVPVFVDMDLGTYVPKIDKIEEAIIEGKTKAIVLAHTLGNCFDSKAIEDLCDEYKIFMISDCCSSMGSTYMERHVETYGDLSTHSYANSVITGGECGSVMANSPMIDDVVKSFLSFGKDKDCSYSRIGYNLKNTDMQAALLSSQIKKLPEFVEKRRYNFMYLDNLMQEFEDWFILPKSTPDSNPAWFGYPITLKSYACSFGRRQLIEYLEAHKVGTRLLFAGNLMKQPAYKDVEYRVHGEVHNSNIISDYSFFLGVWPGITEPMMGYMAETFRDFLKDKR